MAIADFQILKRPARGQDWAAGAAYLKEIAAALDRLGVEHEDQFALVPVSALGDEVAAPTPGAARNSDPDTSKVAAYEQQPRRGTYRKAALEAIIAARDKGLTAEEVGKATGIKEVWKRVSELKQGKWIIASGRTRPNESGSHAEVLIPTAKALEVYVG